ncbi:unnamed protein product [Vitrella brassicaformis CCMP3155]|uniref:VWFA domain-containing protein n=4 Tax=Vitrella brassicaformis TaxID=1169539 RepID=A0A0G4F1M7_VITBC|nr:unnamed protein product [Vitrella brassicaformis CCMP3155]|eukprot:CEM05803.1 unnamed protein product [Vitrella brassicaformis CCMP3155]
MDLFLFFGFALVASLSSANGSRTSTKVRLSDAMALKARGEMMDLTEAVEHVSQHHPMGLPAEVLELLQKLQASANATHVIGGKVDPLPAPPVWTKDSKYAGFLKAVNTLNTMLVETQKEIDLTVLELAQAEETMGMAIDTLKLEIADLDEEIGTLMSEIIHYTNVIQTKENDMNTLTEGRNGYEQQCKTDHAAKEAILATLKVDLETAQKVVNMSSCGGAKQAAGLVQVADITSVRYEREEDRRAGTNESQIFLECLLQSGEKYIRLGGPAGSTIKQLPAHRQQHVHASLTHAHAHQDRRSRILTRARSFLQLAEYRRHGASSSPFLDDTEREFASLEDAAVEKAEGMHIEALYQYMGRRAGGIGAIDFGGFGDDMDMDMGNTVVLQQLRAQLGGKRGRRNVPSPNTTPAGLPPSQEVPDDKCTISASPMCEVFVDSMSTLVGEVQDDITEVEDLIAANTARCTQVIADYNSDLEQTRLELEQASAQLAEKTADKQRAESQKELKERTLAETEQQLHQKREESKATIDQGETTICGIGKIRLELMKMSSFTDYIQDCTVSEWVPGECSHSCGTEGTMEHTRTIVDEPVLGAPCPALKTILPCNRHPCPIDCKMGDWSEWSTCPVTCDQGVQYRYRDVLIQPQHGGEECPSTNQDTKPCQRPPCNKDCVLGEWTDWSPCCRACNGGVQIRTKPVIENSRGAGICWGTYDKERFETKPCNEGPCPDSIICSSKKDIIFAIDNSGSMRARGFNAAKNWTVEFIERTDFGLDKAQIGLIKFDHSSKLVADLSPVKKTVLDAAKGMKFTGGGTRTSRAINMATNMARRGRADAETILFILTDGRVWSRWQTYNAAHAFRKSNSGPKGRIFVLGIGNRLDMKACRSWASKPADLHAFQLRKGFDELLKNLVAMIAAVCPQLRVP